MRIGRGKFALWTIPVCVHAVVATSPPVKVTVQSSWPTAPPLVEILETIALQNESSFFPLLNALTNTANPRLTTSLTPEAIHQLGIETARSLGSFQDATSVSFTKMYLALHAATPKIEAYYQYYSDRHEEKHKDTLSSNTECGSWIEWYGEVVCDLNALAHIIDVDTKDSNDSNASYPRPKILPFDHVYPSSDSVLIPPPRTAILYADLYSSNFWDLHSHLLAVASTPNPGIEYVLRHIPPLYRDMDGRDYLSGYGVALDLKKMDYLALDDRHQKNRDERSDRDHAGDATFEDPVLALLEKYPENINGTVDPASPLTKNELAEIGVQAAQLIEDSPNALTTLKRLSQDFPKYAASISRRVVPQSEVREEIHANSMKARPGINALWLNGASIEDTQMNPFSLLKLLRKEKDMISSLVSLGLTAEQAIDLVSHSAISSVQRESGKLEGIFDASDRAEGGGVITWLNDIETDSRYDNWSPALQTLLRPAYPSQFHNLRRNLFNIIIAVDLNRMESINFVSESIFNIIHRGFPFRFGVVPMVDTEESARMARLFRYFIQVYGQSPTMHFLRRVYRMSPQLSTVDWSVVRSEFNSIISDEERERLREDLGTDFDMIVDGAVDMPLAGVHAYTKRLALKASANPQGHAFVNGKYTVMDESFLRFMQVEISVQTQYLQEQVFSGILTDDIEDVSTLFYDLPGSGSRRNQYIYPTNKPGSIRIVPLPNILSRTGFVSTPGSFISSNETTDNALLTMHVVGNFETEAGLELLKMAVESLDSGPPTRLALVHNPTEVANFNSETRAIPLFVSFVHSKGHFSRSSPATALKALGLETSVSLNGSAPVLLSGIMEKSRDLFLEYSTSCHLFARELGVKPGEQALVVNGRVVGPFGRGEIDADDLAALKTLELSKRVMPVVEALQDVVESLESYDRDSYSELVSYASSIVSAIQIPDPDESVLLNAPHRIRRRGYLLMDGDHTSFRFGDNSTALLQVGIVIDPLSEAAQRWSSLLEWILQIPSVFVELHINPSQYTDLPLKKFYRYNLDSSPSYDEDGHQSVSETVFTGLPVDPVYTLAMDVPQSWLVRPREALHDLDNIQLNTIPRESRTKGLEAAFALDYLIVEGHARESLTNIPPRGLQLQLTTSNSTPIADTQVVLNLGYIQFRAKPGVFQLEIRPGRGRDIFTMESAGNQGWDCPSVEEIGNEITVASFDGLTLYPRLARVPGMEKEEVLPMADAVHSESSPIQKIGSWFSSLLSTEKEEETELAETATAPQADINIFTVASGLLYERFASIMILSVLRNTKSSVKFWFIENFLSPSFLEFIPHFAEEYGFQYELVTYKWPSWLRAQKEKQRIIWAYKILFLDVLFPMDLKKVIFVDADQIVRADLKELVNLDLHGAPYGYTPMGDDNLDMEGFRFWKTGYWSQFLQGRPYHISALYVVDLVRFRQMAAGDLLRGHYQQLSADPGSLSNLDQDLPNNLQSEVPIFSLPEDWLWCETWCSKARLHRAKTIDLCQNPLTKEPKLARARQIPEWEEYDLEIAQFAQRLAAEGRVRSDMAAADSNVLASAAAGGNAAATVAAPVLVEEKAENGGNIRDEL